MLTRYVGDLLVTQGGRYVGLPTLFMLHWDGSKFITHSINVRFYSNFSYSIKEIEGAVFAPIDIPTPP